MARHEKKKERKGREQEKAEQAGEAGKRGIPLAMRFALVIAGLVALFMLGFGLFLRGFIRDAVKQQIRTSAWEAAFTAARADVEAWSDFFGTPFQGQSSEQVQSAAEYMTPQEYEAAFKAPDKAALLAWNRERFSRFLKADSRIVAVELLSPDSPPRLLAQSYGSALMQFEPVADERPLPLPEGAAHEGWLSLGGDRLHVIRGSYPVIDRGGQRRAEFAVYIQAGSIEHATAALMTQVMVSAVAFVAVAAGVAFFVGRRITRPIKLLQEDMRIVADGELEHRTEPHSRDEIGDLAQRFDTMTQTLLASRKSERETAASRHQMTVAGEVAASLIPRSLPVPAGYELAGHHEASGQLSGEYYDVLELGGGRYALLVGAASGRGVPAAMVTAMARSFLTALARSDTDPGRLLREVNALLSADLRRGMYVTMLLAVLDPAAGTLTIANAGHAPMLVWRAASGKLAPVQSEGIALGFDKGPVFDNTLKVVRLTLQPGDRAVLFTPGITRLAGPQGETLGEERFVGLVRREAAHPAALFVRRMAALAKKFRGEQPLSEDVTLLALGRLADGGGAAAGEAPRGPAPAPGGAA